MSIFAKHLTLAVSILACMYTSAFALEFKDLTIDVNNTPQFWLIPAHMTWQYGKGPIKPTHMARLFVVNSKSDRPLPEIQSVFSSETGRSLSAEQKDLIKTGQAIVWLHRQTLVADGKVSYSPADWTWSDKNISVPNCFEVCLYAINKEEMQKLIKAYIEAMNDNAKMPFAEAQAQLERCYLDRDRAMQRLNNAKSEMQNIHVALSPEDIGRVISSTEELKNTLAIDIAGLEAKISRTTQYIGKAEPEVRKRLEAMIIDYNIELAGALAKVKAADEAIEKASSRYAASIRLGELRRESEVAQARVDKSLDAVQEAESACRRIQMTVVWPEIFQNKATIYPIAMAK